MKKITLTTLVLALVLGLAAAGFAQDVRIAASIGDLHQMNVRLWKVDGSTTTEVTDLTGIGMEFGSLVKGPDNVFRSNLYFYVDAPVVSNHTNWYITHTRNDFAKGTDNLNNSVNVKFVKKVEAGTETQLTDGYVTYQNSNSKQINKADVEGGWLRIYYSIVNGSGDASGAVVITPAQPSGSYVGKVILTLSA